MEVKIRVKDIAMLKNHFYKEDTEKLALLNFRVEESKDQLIVIFNDFIPVPYKEQCNHSSGLGQLNINYLKHAICICQEYKMNFGIVHNHVYACDHLFSEIDLKVEENIGKIVKNLVGTRFFANILSCKNYLRLRIYDYVEKKVYNIDFYNKEVIGNYATTMICLEMK